MTEGPEFPIEPWAVRETSLNRDSLGVTESVFALANGHIGMRGTLDEGEPRSVPGTYLNGFYEERPLPHAEAGYGFPESGQTVVNVTDGKLIRLLVVDSPLDLAYGTVLSHERVLDLRSGLLVRRTDWTSPNGHSVRVSSQRLVSFTRRSIAAISYEVEPLDADLYVAVQSDLLANEPLTDGLPSDPRAAAALRSPLRAELADCRNLSAVLVHQTHRSRLRMAAGMDHTYDVPEEVETGLESAGDLARLTIAARLPKGTRLRLVKYLAYGWSSRRSASALRDQVEGGLATAKLAGWDILAQEQRDFLDEHWNNADVEIDGDPELQQAVRVAMFHVLQAGVRAEQQPVAAKGLTGPGYDGHTFWDSETFVLPVLTYTAPEAVRDALRWRHSILDMARARATLLRQSGAVFPWRTIHGEECSGYWPAGTAAFHLNADIADATLRYINATGDNDFEADYGAELLIETARLWASLGHFNGDDRFRITGVTGPDEYTAIVDDNVFTNLMAQRNLSAAAAVAERQPEVADRLEVTGEEISLWRRAAEAMLLPYDETLGVHPQSQGFTHHAEWDFESTPRSSYPLLLHFPYFEIYRKQVIKQADLVLAMHLRGDAFSAADKARNFAYYEARTVRDSSLSAATQAVIAAEVGHLQLAYDYWAEAALGDLHNLHHNSQHGLHIASLAGAWTAAVAGFGGMRDHDGRLTFAPRLPPGLTRLCFRLLFRGRSLRVEVDQSEARYVLAAGEPLGTSHHGEQIEVAVDSPVTRTIPPAPEVQPVHQPHGAAPHRRRTEPGS
ncbi:MAG: glycoside hydrolase family 65 protein [Geodermatophilaceae bacterium]|nr:glycoside hydrolase family 65 protein [Geodermatophilaceae bacterium]